jgi:hypothetical protein
MELPVALGQEPVDKEILEGETRLMDKTDECLNDLCTCVELEWSQIPDPACPIHGDDDE